MPAEPTPNTSPPNELACQVETVEVTDRQRAEFLALIKADTAIGSVDALRQTGVAGTRGQLRAWLKTDPELERAAREARGWNLNRVEAAAWTVAVDTDHPAWDRANARILKAYHPAFRDSAQLEVTGAGGGPVQIEKREVSLTGVLHVLAEAGALPDELAGPLRALAAARDVLPAQPD